MKNWGKVLCILLCLMVIGGCENNEKISDVIMTDDFGSCDWNMTKEELKRKEGEPVKDDESGLTYESELASYPITVYYAFEKDKWSGVLYSFKQEHEDPNLYLNDYEKLLEIYVEKYGEPDIEDENLKNELYKDDKVALGAAISAGDVRLSTIWETNTTTISLNFANYNSKYFLTVLYSKVEKE